MTAAVQEGVEIHCQLNRAYQYALAIVPSEMRQVRIDALVQSPAWQPQFWQQ
ncbi:hypothetical protein D3C87_1968690 [compost metagenome]